MADPKVEQPTLQRLYLAPSCRARPKAATAQALELLAEIFGGGPTSYLYRKLVLERGIAVNAGAWYMGSAIEDTRLASTPCRPGACRWRRWKRRSTRRSATAADQALDGDAIERAKTRLVAETIYASDSQSSLARIYGSALAIGETLEDVRRWPLEIEAVLRADLVAAAERSSSPAAR